MNFDTKTNKLGWLINQLLFTVTQDPFMKGAWATMPDEDKARLKRDLVDQLRYNL